MEVAEKFLNGILCTSYYSKKTDQKIYMIFFETYGNVFFLITHGYKLHIIIYVTWYSSVHTIQKR